MHKKKRRKRKKCAFSLCCTANVSDSDEDTKELDNALSNVCSQAQEAGSTEQDSATAVTGSASLSKNKNALKQKYKSLSKETGIPSSKETVQEKKAKNGPWGKIRASLAKFKGNNGALEETVPVQMPTKKIWTFSEVFKSQGSRVSIEKINENASREQTKRSISQASDGPELRFERLARPSSRETNVVESSDRRMCRRRPKDTDSLHDDISEATQIQVLMPAVDENMTTFQKRIQPSVKDISNESIESVLQSQEQSTAGLQPPQMEAVELKDLQREENQHSSSTEHSCQVIAKDISSEKTSVESDLQCQKPTNAAKKTTEMEVVNPTDVHKERNSRSLSLKKSDQAVVNDISSDKKSVESDLQCQKPATATKRATEVEVVKPTDVHKERRSRSLSLKKSGQAVVNDISSEKKSVESDLQCQKPATATKRATEVEVVKPTDVHKARRSRSLSLKKSSQANVNDIPKEKKSVERDLQCQKQPTATKKATEMEVVNPTDVHKERRSRSLSLKKSDQAVVNNKSSEKKSVGSDLQCQKPASASKRATEVEAAKPTDVHKRRRSRSLSLKKSGQAVVNDISKEKKSVGSDLQCQKPARAAKRDPEVEAAKPTDVQKERRSRSLSLKKSVQAVVNDKSSEKKSVGSDLQCQKPATATMRATEVEAAKPTDVHKERRSRSLSLKKSGQAVVNGISKEKKSVGRDLQWQKPASASKRATEVEAAKPTDVHKERRSRSLSLKKSGQAVVNDISKEKKSVGSDLQCQKPARAAKRAPEVEVCNPTDVHKERRSRSLSQKKKNNSVVKDIPNEKKSLETDLKHPQHISSWKKTDCVKYPCANAIIDVTGFIPVDGDQSTPLIECTKADESQIEKTMIENAISYQVEEFVKILAIQAAWRAVEEQILPRSKESGERNEEKKKKHSENIWGPEPFLLNERDPKGVEFRNVSVTESKLGSEIEFGEDAISRNSCKEEHIPTMNKKYLISCLAQKKKSIAVKKSVRFSDDLTIRRITDFAPHGEYYSNNENTIACLSEKFEYERKDEVKPNIYTLNIEKNNDIAEELSSLGQIKEIDNFLLIEKESVKIEEGLLISRQSRHSYNVDLIQKDKTSSSEDPIVTSRIEEKDSINLEVTSFDKQAFILNETKERDLSQKDKTDKLLNTQSLIPGSDKHYSIPKESTYSQETCISSFRDRVDAFSVKASEGQPRDTVSSDKESASPIKRRHFVDPSQKDEVTCEEKSIISNEIKECVNPTLPLNDELGCSEDRNSSDVFQKEIHISHLSLLKDCVSSEVELITKDNDSIEKEHTNSIPGKAKDCTPSSAQKAEETFGDHAVILSQSKEAVKPILLPNASESESVFLSRQVEDSQNADEKEMSKCEVELIKEDKNTHEQQAVISIATKEEESCDSVQYVQDCLVESFKSSCQVKESDIRCRTESDSSEDKCIQLKPEKNDKNVSDDLVLKEVSSRSSCSNEMNKVQNLRSDGGCSEEESSASNQNEHQKNLYMTSQGNTKHSLNSMQKAEDSMDEYPVIPCQRKQAEHVLLQKKSETIGDEPIVQRQVEGRWNPDVSVMSNFSFEEESLSLSLSKKRHVVDLVQKDNTPHEQQTIISTEIQERESAYLIQRDEATSEPQLIVSIMNSSENKERNKVVSKESNVERFQGDSNCSEEESSRSNHFTPRRNPDFNDDFVYKEDSSRSSCSRECDKVHRIQSSEQELYRPNHFTSRGPPDLNDDFVFKEDSSRSSCSTERDKVHRFRGDSNCSEEEPSRSKQFTPRRNPELMDDFVYKEDLSRSSCSTERDKVHRFQRDISTSEDKQITSPQIENQKNPEVKENGSISFEKEHINSSQGNTKTSPDVMQKPEHFWDEHPAISSQIKESDKPIISDTSRNESIRDEPMVLREVVGKWNPDVSEMSNFSFETESLSCNHSKERDKVQRLQSGYKGSDEELSRSNQCLARRNPDLMDDFVCKEDSSRSSCSDKVHRFRIESNCSEEQLNRSKQFTPRRKPDFDDDFVFKEDSTRSSCSSDRDKVHRFRKESNSSEEHQSRRNQFTPRRNPDLMDDFVFKEDSTQSSCSNERDNVPRLKSRAAQFTPRRNPDLEDDFVFREDSPQSSCSNERDNVPRFKDQATQFTPRRNADSMDDFVFREDSSRSNTSKEGENMHIHQRYIESSEEEQSRSNQFIPRRGPDLMDDFVYKENSTKFSCFKQRDNKNFIQVERTFSGEKVIEKDEDSIGFVQRFADIFNKLSVQPSQNNEKDTSDLKQEKELSHEEHPLINERDEPRTGFPQGFLKNTTYAGEHERPADIQNKKRSVINKSVRFSEDHQTWILGDSMLSDVDCGYNKDKIINIQQTENHRDMLIQPVEHKTMKKGKLPKLQCEKRNGDEVPVGKIKGAAKSGKTGKGVKKATKPSGKVKKSASWTDVYSDDTDYELDSDVFCSDDDQPPKGSTEKPSIPAFTLGYQKLPSISKGSPTS